MPSREPEIVASQSTRCDPRRLLSAEEKLTISQALYQTALAVKIGVLRLRYADWSEVELEKAARRLLFFMHD